jgi:hypothetical protein
MNDDANNNPFVPDNFYSKYINDWFIVDTLIEGIDKIKELSLASFTGEDKNKYLPDNIKKKAPVITTQPIIYNNPNESIQNFITRLQHSYMPHSYEDAIDKASSRIIKGPSSISFSEEFNGKIKGYLDNVDLSGMSIYKLCSSLAYDLIQYGSCGGLVAFADLKSLQKIAVKQLGRELTEGEVPDNINRPFFQQITPSDVIGRKVEAIGSYSFIKQLRIKGFINQDVGLYGNNSVPFVDVHEVINGVYTITRHFKNEADSKTITPIRNGAPISYIPVVQGSLLKRQKSLPFCGKPVFNRLAKLTIHLLNSISALNNLIRIAQIPILVKKSDDSETSIEISSSAINLGINDDLLYVEVSGKSIEAGEKQVERLNADVETQGLLSLLRKNAGQITATSATLSHIETKNSLHAITLTLIDVINNIIKEFAKWESIDDSGTISINPDLTLPILESTALAELLLKSTSLDFLSVESFLHFLKGQSPLLVGMDVQEELQKIKNEKGNISDEE